DDPLEPPVVPEEAGPQYEQTRAILAHSGVTLPAEGETTLQRIHAQVASDLHPEVAPVALVAHRLWLEGRPPMDLDVMDAVLEREWGSEAETKWLYVTRAWAEVPADDRKQMIADGLAQQPDMFRKMAELGERLSDPRRPANMARLLKPFREE
ncbi:MAG TPA: hypothetical protein VML54_05955, partial [Candidatus Limnocylindrales bacterium]|nr:hypothetical protein [Candidatus Limnocylindrales bacterium]